MIFWWVLMKTLRRPMLNILDYLFPFFIHIVNGNGISLKKEDHSCSILKGKGYFFSRPNFTADIQVAKWSSTAFCVILKTHRKQQAIHQKWEHIFWWKDTRRGEPKWRKLKKTISRHRPEQIHWSTFYSRWRCEELNGIISRVRLSKWPIFGLLILFSRPRGRCPLKC